jgi:acetyl-CoA C-acetyltransferase
MEHEDIVITGYARTPFGALAGALGTVPAPTLGATAIKGALERSGVTGADVSEVLMGCVLPAGVGQAPARQACLGAGIPESVPCATVNKVCGSGMFTLILGVQSLQLGSSDIVVAGGMENMTLAPYLLPDARGGMRMGDKKCVDSMVLDGLWDPYNNQHMGNCAELCARENGFSREDQDTFTINSYKRAQDSREKVALEIVPVEVPGRKGKTTTVEIDEGPDQVNFEKIPSLRPVFDREGSVTAANASSINDGAAACVLMRASTAKERGCEPLGRIVSHGRHAQSPEWFTTAPIQAIEKALKKASWTVDTVDLFEVNEAFAVVTLAAQQALDIPSEKVNIWGGAVAIGHPIGASGTRIVGTLIQQLRDRGLKRGVAAICIGGGEALAICVEAL